MSTARTALTIAALTLREATRRRVLLALAVLTVLLLVLSAWGFVWLAVQCLICGEARLTFSVLLILVMLVLRLFGAMWSELWAGTFRV